LEIELPNEKDGMTIFIFKKIIPTSSSLIFWMESASCGLLGYQFALPLPEQVVEDWYNAQLMPQHAWVTASYSMLIIIDTQILV
jgi:hypothetical protein